MSHEAFVKYTIQAVSWWDFQPTDDKFREYWDKTLGKRCALKCFTYLQLGLGMNQLEYEFKLTEIQDEKELRKIISGGRKVWGKACVEIIHLLI